MENLLAKANPSARNKLYAQIRQLMYCCNEEDFDQLYALIMEEYNDFPLICNYIKKGWCEHACRWRKLWPKFGRLFNYRHVDTTNLVERHWHYIKLTTLRGKINRYITDLLHTLVGDSVTGTWLGGTVLEWFKHKQEISECGRFLPHA